MRSAVAYDDALVSRVLAEARADVQAELERVFARRRRTGYEGWIGFHTPEAFRALFRAAGFARAGWIDLLPGFGLAVGQKARADRQSSGRKS